MTTEADHNNVPDRRPITIEILEELGFERNTIDDEIDGSWQEVTYYTYELSNDKYTDLCLLTSYIEEGDITIELFPYEAIKFNKAGKVKMIIEALKGDE